MQKGQHYLLISDENDGHIGTEVLDFRRPFLRDVLERVRRVDAEAHQDHVGVGIGKWPEAIVVLLTGRVPQRQLDLEEEREDETKPDLG